MVTTADENPNVAAVRGMWAAYRARGLVGIPPTQIRFGDLLVVPRGLRMGYGARVTRHLLARDSVAPAAARALVTEFERDMGWRAGDGW